MSGALWRLLVWLQIATNWTLSQTHLGVLSKGLTCLISSRLTEIQLLHVSVRHHVMILSDINSNLHCLSAKTATTLTLTPSNQCYNYNFNNLAPKTKLLQLFHSGLPSAVCLSRSPGLSLVPSPQCKQSCAPPAAAGHQQRHQHQLGGRAVCSERINGGDGYYSLPAGSGTLLFVFY